MQIHDDLIQGSPEWIAFRSTHDGSSEAAAVLGLSRKLKRDELMRMKATGAEKEFSDWVRENILAKGHEVEAMARPHAERFLGETLYPVTCSDGPLSASCDGLTFDGETAFEHKQWAKDLADSVTAGELPEEHKPQCQQIMLVTGAKRVMFMVSDGTPENMVWMWVYSDPEWHQRILAAWEQFNKDLATYVPPAPVVQAVAEPIQALPTLYVQTRGEVVTSNLPAYKAAAEQFLATINTDLATDDQFAQADADAKFCREAVEKLAQAKGAALAQTASIDEVLRAIDVIAEQFRQKAIGLERDIEAKKKAIKDDIAIAAKKAFAAHVAELEAEIIPLKLVVAQPDTAGAMKSKRTLESLRNAVNTELANAKIAASQAAQGVRNRLTWFSTAAKDYDFLFADLQALIQKPDDDFTRAVNQRITDHQAAEAERAARERVTAETKRQLEEQAAQAAAARQAEDQRRATEVERYEVNQTSNVAPIVTGAAGSIGQPHAITGTPGAGAGAVRPVDGPAILGVGDFGSRLGFTISVAFVSSLGIEPAEKVKGMPKYRESDFLHFCTALLVHVRNVAQAQMQQAA